MPRPPRRHRLTGRARLLALTPLLAPAPLFAQTAAATWLAPTSGTWSDPLNWSTNPSYPNDPSLDALLTAVGSPYTVTLDSPVSLRSLTGTSPDASLNLTAGGTLTLSSSLNLGPGSLTLNGGTLAGGTLSSNLSATGGTLTNTTLAATLSATGAVTLAPSFSLAPNASIHLTSRYAAAVLGGAAGTPGAGTLSGAGEVVFDNIPTSGYLSSGFGAPQSVPTTIGPNVTVRTGLGSGVIAPANSYPNQPLTNHGTISAQTPGQYIFLFATNLTNTGTIQATNHSTLILWGSPVVPFSTSALSSISTSDGGTAYIMGAKVGSPSPSSPATYTLSAGHAVGIGADARVQYTTISSTDGTPLPVYPYMSASHPTPTGTATLTTCDVLAPVSVRPGATLLVTNSSSLTGPVSVDAATLLVTSFSTITGALTASNASTVTLATSDPGPAAISLSASTLNINSKPASLGSLTLSASTLTLNASLPDYFTSPISLTDSIVNINAPFSSTQFALLTASRTRSPLNINAPITNTGNTVPLDAATGPLNLLSSITSAGSITGGTLGTSPDALVVLGTANVTSGPTPTLQDVTLAGTLSVSPAVTAQARGTLTLSNAHISLSPGNPLSSIYPTRLGVDWLVGTGDVSFDGAPNASFANESFSTPYVPAGVTVHTGANSGTVSATSVAGTISAQTPGQGIGLTAAYLTGTLAASNASTLTLFTTSGQSYPFSNITSTHTLTAGSWTASAGGTLLITSSTLSPETHVVPITTLGPAASVTLSGPTSSFPSLDTLSTNNGSFTLTDGRSFTTQSDLTNTGSLTLGPSASLTVTGTLTNSGSLSLAPTATLSLPAGPLLWTYPTPAASPIDTVRHYLHDAQLTSPATDPTHRLAYADSGTTVAVSLALTGDANLDGQVDADDYALLDRAYARSLTSAHWTDGDFNYDGLIDQNDYRLIDTTFAASHPLTPAFLSQRESQFGPAYVSTLLTAVPEPASLASLLLLLPLTRRRRT